MAEISNCRLMTTSFISFIFFYTPERALTVCSSDSRRDVCELFYQYFRGSAVQFVINDQIFDERADWKWK
jgi:hypothetical protein